MSGPSMIRGHQRHHDMAELLFSDNTNERCDPLLQGYRQAHEDGRAGCYGPALPAVAFEHQQLRPRQRQQLFDEFRRAALDRMAPRSEEHTSELQSLMRISYAVFCLKKKKQNTNN